MSLKKCEKDDYFSKYMDWHKMRGVYKHCLQQTDRMKELLIKEGIRPSQYMKVPGSSGSKITMQAQDYLYTLLVHWHGHLMNKPMGKQTIDKRLKKKEKHVQHVHVHSGNSGQLDFGSLDFNSFLEDDDDTKIKNHIRDAMHDPLEYTNAAAKQKTVQITDKMKQALAHKSHQKKKKIKWARAPEESKVTYKFAQKWNEWKKSNHPIDYEASCCRSKQNQDNPCSGVHVNTKDSCEAKHTEECIWGILNDESIGTKLSIGNNWNHHAIRHYDKYQFSKHEFVKIGGYISEMGVTLPEKVHEPLDLFPNNYHEYNHYFAYDRCGNYAKLRVNLDIYKHRDNTMNNPLHLGKNHLDLIKYVQSSLANNAQYAADPTNYVYGYLKGRGRGVGGGGTGTLISEDRVLTCTHNVAEVIQHGFVYPDTWWNDPYITDIDHKQEHKQEPNYNDPMANWGLMNLNKFKFTKGNDFTKGQAIDFVIFDIGGGISFPHDFAVAALKDNYNPGGPLPHPPTHIFPFGFEQYGTTKFMSIGVKFTDLSIDTTDHAVQYTNTKKESYIERNNDGQIIMRASPWCPTGTLRTTNGYLYELKKGKKATSGQSGSLCYDIEWNQHGLLRPFINGVYVGSFVHDEQEMGGHVARFNLPRFLLICDVLKPADKATQCDPVFNRLRELFRDVRVPPFCSNNENQFLWESSQLKCILDTISDDEHCVVKNGRPSLQKILVDFVTSNNAQDVAIKVGVCRYTLSGAAPNDWRNSQRVIWNGNGGNNAMIAYDNQWMDDYFHSGNGEVQYENNNFNVSGFEAILAVDTILLMIIGVCCVGICGLIGFGVGCILGEFSYREKNEHSAE